LELGEIVLKMARRRLRREQRRLLADQTLQCLGGDIRHVVSYHRKVPSRQPVKENLFAS
jgi:hypothetical protein